MQFTFPSKSARAASPRRHTGQELTPARGSRFVVREFLERGLVIAAVFTAVLCQRMPAQDAESKDAQSREVKGIPPRATPGDYPMHTQVGAVTIAAEFTGHSVPTFQSTYSTEDYVVVEVGLFGPPQARTKLSYEDFSLRINGKKTILPAQPYVLVFKSLKDPEWAPPESAASKSNKTSLSTGGANDTTTTPAPVHVPIEVERAMEQRVQKAALPEGDRPLPEAGLLFFQHHGKTTGLRSLELIYSGAAGKTILALQP
jgi:hypothetical protein